MVSSASRRGKSQSLVLIEGITPAGLGAALAFSEAGQHCAIRGSVELLRHHPGICAPATPEHYWVMCEGLGREQAALWWRIAVEGARSLREWLRKAGCPHESGALLQLAVNAAEFGEMQRSLELLNADGFLEVRMMGSGAASNYVSVNEVEGAMYSPWACTFDPLQAGLALLNLVDQSAAPHRACILTRIEERGVFPMRGQSGFFPASDGPHGGVVAITANRMHILIRPHAGRWLVSGLNPGAGPSEFTSVPETNPKLVRTVGKVAGRTLMDLQEAEPEDMQPFLCWQSRDGVPLLGAVPGASDTYVAAGFGAAEWSWGFGAGQLLARFLMGTSDTILPKSGSLRRF